MVDQWTVVWWCLMVITADAGLASGVEECFLYPVKKGEQSPSVPLNASGDTIITINNIYDNNTITNITTDNGVCVVQVLHKRYYQVRVDGCPVFDASAVDNNSGTWQELVTVVVRPGGGRTSVYLWDSGDHEHQVKVNLGDASTIHVVSEEFVNVAYGCYNGCFQFQNATIHKSFRDGRHGSLLFYGRVMGSEPPNRPIYALRDAGWSQRKGFYLNESIMNNTHWFAFRALPKYTKDRGRDTLSLTLRYETAASSCSPENPACNTGQAQNYAGEVPNRDLYLTFDASENVRWAVFCWPRATSQEPGEEDQPALTTSQEPGEEDQPALTTSQEPGDEDQPALTTSQEPGEEDQPALKTSQEPGEEDQTDLTTTTSPTAINSIFPVNNSYQTKDFQEKVMLWSVMWSALVLAVVCVLLLLVNVFFKVTIVRRQPPPSRPSHPHTAPHTAPFAVTSLPNNDPANHTYEYLELDPL